MRNLMIICLALILMSSHCKKEGYDPVTGLPDATQTGKKTFGAMVNGVLFINKHSAFQFVNDLYASYSIPVFPNTSYLTLYATDYTQITVPSIEILSIAALQQGQTYQLQSSSTNSVSVQYLADTDYTVAPPLTGQLTITKLDLQQGIISGTFYFDAVNSSGDKVSVTDGRFDVKL